MGITYPSIEIHFVHYFKMSSAAFRVIFAQFLIALLIADNDTGQCDGDCPLWTAADSDSCECKCGSDLKGKVICEDSKGATALRNCFCMTISKENEALVGICYSTCWISNETHYQLATSRKQDLNNKTCEPFNRKGFLCSECLEGYGLPVYSYNLSCVECSESDRKHNWVKYIAVAYLPLTLFCFAVIIFRVPVTSGWLIGYVALSQILTIRGFVLWYLQHWQKFKIFINILLTMTSVWNLDFFRSLYPPFCLHPHFSALHIFVLDYLVALYPLMLIFLTYLVVKLHDRFMLVTWLCRPLYRCFHHFRKEWDIETSLIGTFATFYLLSYVKVVNVTADILTSVSFENTSGMKERNLYVFYNASLQYFGDEHQPYVIFAVLFSFFFNACPLILLLVYPCGCLHRCLNRTWCRCHTLHLFMDVMLGAYSHKPRERRYFSAFYFLLRIVHVLGFSLLDPFSYIKTFSYTTAIAIALTLVFRPYKSKTQNVVDIVLLCAVLHTYSSILCLQLGKLVQPESRSNGIVFIVFLVVLPTLPLYGIVVLTTRVMPWKVISHSASKFCKAFKKSIELEETLPDLHDYTAERKTVLLKETYTAQS